MRSLICLLLTWPLLGLAQNPAQNPAQYPAKAVHMIIPFPPGGATDIIGRVVSQKLGERLGQPVVVDNRPGAGGTIGSEVVAKAAPDGYTLLISTNSTHAVAMVLSKPPYDAARDFTPLPLLAESATTLAV